MTLLTAQQVMDIIPNRYPIFFIDAVDELIPGEKIVCRKNVTINEQVFQGHFPGEPVLPGVYICEALVDIVKLRKNAGIGYGQAFVGDKKVAEAEMTFIIGAK